MDRGDHEKLGHRNFKGDDMKKFLSCSILICLVSVLSLRGADSGVRAQSRGEREAAASGIRRMLGDTLYGNKAMLRLAASSGYAVRANPDDARLVKLEKQLSASTPRPKLHQFAA